MQYRLISLAVLLAAGGCSKEAVAMEMQPTAQPEIVAHRGFSFAAPENTKAAVELAWQVGCPAVECDVHLTRDRRIMLMHDKSAKRTGGVDWTLAETDSADLRKLDVGSWKDPNYAGEPIPFLEDILDTIPEGRTLFIEIKCGPEILEPLKILIDRSCKHNQLAIISFNLEVAAKAKRLMPRIPAYWLVGTEENKLTGKPIPHSPGLIQTTLEKGLDGLDVHHAGITEAFAREVRSRGLRLYTWTVDDLTQARRLARLGICGITTNCPDRLMKIENEK